MIGPRALLRSDHGAAALEFGLLAPVFLMMMLGLFEGGRMFWTRQVVSEVAYSTARCMSVNTACNTATLQKNYAVDRARRYGVRIVAANVTPVANTTCRSQTGSNSVTVSVAFTSAARGFVPLPATLSSTACFPVLT